MFLVYLACCILALYGIHSINRRFKHKDDDIAKRIRLKCGHGLDDWRDCPDCHNWKGNK